MPEEGWKGVAVQGGTTERSRGNDGTEQRTRRKDVLKVPEGVCGGAGRCKDEGRTLVIPSLPGIRSVFRNTCANSHVFFFPYANVGLQRNMPLLCLGEAGTA